MLGFDGNSSHLPGIWQRRKLLRLSHTFENHSITSISIFNWAYSRKPPILDLLPSVSLDNAQHVSCSVISVNMPEVAIVLLFGQLSKKLGPGKKVRNSTFGFVRGHRYTTPNGSLSFCFEERDWRCRLSNSYNAVMSVVVV